MPSFKLIQFAGLIPRTPSHNLPPITAQVAHDVDLSQGTLKPWRTDRNIAQQTARSFFYEDCCLLTSDNCLAEFCRLPTACGYYLASGIADYPVIKTNCGDEWQRLGFPDELPAPTAQRLGGEMGDFNAELREYAYTLVDKFGFESQLSDPSEPIYAHNDFPVVISNLPSHFPTYAIETIRIYCAVTPLDYGEGIKDNQAEGHFLQVAELPFGTTSTAIQPHIQYGSECTTDEYAPPPADLHSLHYCGNGQVGGLANGELWLSEPLQPHAFPESYRYGNFRSKPIRFLASETVGYVLTDGFPAVIEQAQPPQAHGMRAVTQLQEPLPLIAYQSACVYQGACFYASEKGLVMLSGTQARIITGQLWTAEQWQALAPWTMKGTAHDGYYFATTDTGTYRFKLPENVHSDSQFDSLTTLSIKPTAYYRCSHGRLYFADEQGIWEWSAGTQWKHFTWRGRLHTMAGYTALTAYKIVQDFAENRVKHTAYKRHRNDLVGEPVILGDKIVQDSRPHRLKAGFSTLQFEVEISGQGEVWEYHIASSVAELGAE